MALIVWFFEKLVPRVFEFMPRISVLTKLKFPSSFDVKKFFSYYKKFFVSIDKFIPGQAGACRSLQESSDI